MGWRAASKNWTGAVRRYFGGVKNLGPVFDQPLMTIPVARERSDREQRLYGIRGFAVGEALEFGSISMVSDTDILIHRIRAVVGLTGGFFIDAGASAAAFTPVVTVAGGEYIPFLNNVVTFVPQVRPQADSLTIAIAGTNPTAFPLHAGSPGWGPLALQPSVIIGVGTPVATGGECDIWASSTGETPVWVPAGNILSVQGTRVAYDLQVSFWFEEMQRAAVSV